jgi:hypothetical protein
VSTIHRTRRITDADGFGRHDPCHQKPEQEQPNGQQHLGAHPHTESGDDACPRRHPPVGRITHQTQTEAEQERTAQEDQAVVIHPAD